MDKDASTEERPVVVWESAAQGGDGGWDSLGGGRREATVQVVRTGQPDEEAAPVIRIFSTGFGRQQAPGGSRDGIRMAA